MTLLDVCICMCMYMYMYMYMCKHKYQADEMGTKTFGGKFFGNVVCVCRRGGGQDLHIKRIWSKPKTEIWVKGVRYMELDF